ncbi:nitroreductase family protein, partial [bacterium]|nr:nitroreductase family protein [bacterium]
GKKITQISEARIELCIECGHCQAICPNVAIQVDKMKGQSFDPLVPLGIDENQMLSLMKQRRSVRQYKKKPIPRVIIDQIIEAARFAPTGTAQSSNGIIVVESPETLKELSELYYDLYKSLDKMLNNPVGRFLIKHRAGTRMMNTLKDFVIPGMRWYIKWYQEGKSNEILRDCPVLMLFHSHVDVPMADKNSLIAAFHSIFMAEILGIGTCFNDLIPIACNYIPKVKDILALPKDHEVYASLTMGYPKYKFKRAIPRQLADVRYI